MLFVRRSGKSRAATDCEFADRCNRIANTARSDFTGGRKTRSRPIRSVRRRIVRRTRGKRPRLFYGPSGCSCFWIGGSRPPASSSRLARFYTRPHPRRKTGRRRSPALARSLVREGVSKDHGANCSSPGPVNEQTRSRRSKVRVEEEIRS